MARRAAVLALAAASVAGLALVSIQSAGVGQSAKVGRSVEAPVVTPSKRPRLALITSLPLMFTEQFSLDLPKSDVLARLERYYLVEPVGVADAASLSGKQLLLMAHPRAQPAEALVELDRWVRDGGRLLLLADPMLDWHSDRPLGDRLRPPVDFADTGLLKHWGLRLDGPIVNGPRIANGGGYDVMTSSPGTLASADSNCTVEAGGLVARCGVGRGSVTVIADADFLNVSGKHSLDGPTGPNLDLLMAELSRVGSR